MRSRGTLVKCWGRCEKWGGGVGVTTGDLEFEGWASTLLYHGLGMIGVDLTHAFHPADVGLGGRGPHL